MKLSALLLLVVLAIAAALAHGLQVDTKGTHLRQLQEQPSDQPQLEQGDGGDYGDDDGDDDYGDDDEITRCYPGSWSWPRCRFDGCFPGSWNWPRCRDGGCFPGSWNWPRCRDGGCFPGSWNWPRCRHKL